MKINGWDISEAGAKTEQWNVEPGFHSVSNDSEWVRGSPIPVFFKNQIGFKKLKIAILVRAEQSRQSILNQCSEILSHLLEPAELEMDDFEHKFCGIMTKHTLEENPLGIPWVKYNRASKLVIEFSCYEYAEAAPVTGTSEIEIDNPGNIETPVTIEIIPKISFDVVTLTGICRDQNTGEDLPVIVKNLIEGKKIILDGEKGLFTEDGSIKADIDVWNIPSIMPGVNKIMIDNQWMDITIRYRPRFM